MSDQAKLPYFIACLQELQRISVILTLNLQRITSEDMEIDGYFLPKGTIVVPQFPSVHVDEDVFPDPFKFDPTRHLDENGNFIKDDRITPFSVGKRACLGESLARMELFLFSATFFQHFEFLPENDGKIPAEEYEPGLVKSPKAFKVRAKERH
jgi:cytochrome P450